MNVNIRDIVADGDEITILNMDNGSSFIDDSKYSGRCGVVSKIDDADQIHGTWGSLALMPKTDTFLIKGKGVVQASKFYENGTGKIKKLAV